MARSAPAPVEFPVAIGTLGAVTARHYQSSLPGSPLLVLAHGAGADQRHRFMTAMGRLLSERGVDVVTFNFLYTEMKRRGPDRPAVLEETWLRALDAVVDRLEPQARVAVGGKSMGGRIASMVAAATPGTDAWKRVEGLVLLGYPLHPPGRPEAPRTAHLPSIRMPILVVQGTRDTFGTRAEVEPIFSALRCPVAFEFVEQGDHSFAVPKSTGRTEADVLASVADRVAQWLGPSRENR